jgi:deoxycytidine triphosphate deaminase
MPLGNIALREAIEDGRLSIHPKPVFPRDYDTDAVHLHLSNVFHVLKSGVRYTWDPNEETITQWWQRQLRQGKAIKIVLKPGQIFRARPGKVFLAETREVVGLPLRRRSSWAGKKLLSGKFSGRSRYARAFLGVHITADIFHPGSAGTKAIEGHNLGPVTVFLRPGDAVCQLQCDEVLGEMVETENFTNGQHSAIGERNFGSDVVDLVAHPKFKQGNKKRSTWKRGRQRAKSRIASNRRYQ